VKEVCMRQFISFVFVRRELYSENDMDMDMAGCACGNQDMCERMQGKESMPDFRHSTSKDQGEGFTI
jgi:hypothetical protein